MDDQKHKIQLADSFDVIANIKRTQSEEELHNILLKVCQRIGMTSFGISGIPLPNENVEPFFLLSGWDEEWFERYTSGNYVHSDPIIHKCVSSIEPFTWEKAVTNRRLGAKAQRIMNEAQEFRMFYGFSVPIHSIHGHQAIVTFGSEHYELSEHDESSLHMIAIYAHAQLRKMKQTMLKENFPREATRVTPRERECILWASDGKTNDDIAELMSISRRMVEEHLARAGDKMMTCGKAHLVAESIRHGIIR